MAHTKAKGSTQLGRDSRPKYLGIKRADGQKVKLGEVLVKQRGTKYFPGLNVKRGRDDTLYSLKAGRVKFTTRKRIRFDGKRKFVKVVNVL